MTPSHPQKNDEKFIRVLSVMSHDLITKCYVNTDQSYLTISDKVMLNTYYYNILKAFFVLFDF